VQLIVISLLLSLNSNFHLSSTEIDLLKIVLLHLHAALLFLPFSLSNPLSPSLFPLSSFNVCLISLFLSLFLPSSFFLFLFLFPSIFSPLFTPSLFHSYFSFIHSSFLCFYFSFYIFSPLSVLYPSIFISHFSHLFLSILSLCLLLLSLFVLTNCFNWESRSRICQR
jgi:hypothetical protein